MPEFQLSKAAEDDIASIANYTIFKFGIGQARKYRNRLIDSLAQIAHNPELGQVFILPNGVGLKRFRYKAHMVFYKEISSGILVARILRGMMDFKRHF